MIYHLVRSVKSTRRCSTVLKEVCRCFRLPALPLPREGARGFRSQRPSCISWKLDCRNEEPDSNFRSNFGAGQRWSEAGKRNHSNPAGTIGYLLLGSVIGILRGPVITTGPSHATGLSAVLAGFLEATIFNPFYWLGIVLAFGLAFWIVRKP